MKSKSKTKNHPFNVGKKYFIRTVTHYFTGQLVKVFDTEIVLKDASWIADTGRYADFLKTMNPNECEPYPDGEVVIGRGSIIDATEIKLAIPRVQK